MCAVVRRRRNVHATAPRCGSAPVGEPSVSTTCRRRPYVPRRVRLAPSVLADRLRRARRGDADVRVRPLAGLARRAARRARSARLRPVPAPRRQRSRSPSAGTSPTAAAASATPSLARLHPELAARSESPAADRRAGCAGMPLAARPAVAGNARRSERAVRLDAARRPVAGTRGRSCGSTSRRGRTALRHAGRPVDVPVAVVTWVGAFVVGQMPVRRRRRRVRRRGRRRRRHPDPVRRRGGDVDRLPRRDVAWPRAARAPATSSRTTACASAPSTSSACPIGVLTQLVAGPARVRAARASCGRTRSPTTGCRRPPRSWPTGRAARRWCCSC